MRHRSLARAGEVGRGSGVAVQSEPGGLRVYRVRGREWVRAAGCVGSDGEAWAQEDPVEDMFRCPEARVV